MIILCSKNQFNGLVLNKIESTFQRNENEAGLCQENLVSEFLLCSTPTFCVLTLLATIENNSIKLSHSHYSNNGLGLTFSLLLKISFSSEFREVKINKINQVKSS
jgi:hypothetical protein